jgi:hypothetical protein
MSAGPEPEASDEAMPETSAEPAQVTAHGANGVFDFPMPVSFEEEPESESVPVSESEPATEIQASPTVARPLVRPVTPQRVGTVGFSRDLDEIASAHSRGGGWGGGDSGAWLKALPVLISLVFSGLVYLTFRTIMGGKDTGAAAAAAFSDAPDRQRIVATCAEMVRLAQETEVAMKKPGAPRASILGARGTAFEAMNEGRKMRDRALDPPDYATAQAGNEVAGHVLAYLNSFNSATPDEEGKEVRAAEQAFEALKVVAAAPRPADDSGKSARDTSAPAP